MTSSSTNPASSMGNSKHSLFPPLSDPVGYAGNFAANLDGRLITGGGSQFIDKPLWLNGQKVYTDRLFALAEPAGSWTELKTRLPEKIGHFAFAASTEAVYLAGGIHAEGLSKKVFEVRAQGSEVVIKPLPDLPKAVVYAAGGLANGRFYIAGGQHDPAVKAASHEVWSLDVGQPGEWRREPDLPAPGTFVAATASDGRNLYVIGGVGFDAEGTPVQSCKIHRLAPEGKAWQELADLPEPRVGPVTPCPILDGKRIFVMGGYVGFFAGEKRDHPGFSRQTFFYDIDAQSWSEGPVLPHEKPVDKDSPSDQGPAPMVAASGAIWKDHFVAIGGEVRASVRTPAVVAYPLNAL